MENDLGRDPIRRLVLRIAIPSMLAQFVSVLYSVVDRMYIGNIPEVGNLALAGAGVCGPIVTMIGSVAFLVGVGGSPLVSIRMGAGDNEGAKRILANCFVLLVGLAAALMALAYATRRPVLLLFGASEASLPYAETYYSVYLTGTVFALLSTGMNQFIICQGFAKKGMLSVMLGAVLNIVLDPVFIFVLDMGVAGAAVATVLSQLASCIFVLVFLFGRQPPIRITFGGYSARIMGRVMATGFTPFIIIAFDNVMIIALNSLLQKYGGAGQGDLLVAAATIAQSFMLVVTMPRAASPAAPGPSWATTTGPASQSASWRPRSSSSCSALATPPFCSSSARACPGSSCPSFPATRRWASWRCGPSASTPWASSRWRCSIPSSTASPAWA